MNYIPKVNESVIMKTGKKGVVKREKLGKYSNKPYLYVVEIDGKEVVAVPSDFKCEG